MSSRRSEILVGARKCFAEYGYDGATVRRLEEATGKSRGAIFHHFADKESLFFALAKQDAARMAQTVAEEGLVEVMREMLDNPGTYDWFSTRTEITRLIKTDPAFAAQWKSHQEILDRAVRARLQQGVDEGRMRTDVPVEVIHTYLEVFMDGMIARLAAGDGTAVMDRVLDMVEDSVRRKN
nr:TetR/AcrR family transcriptional regulator [Corynebacterium mendelii]